VFAVNPLPTDAPLLSLSGYFAVNAEEDQVSTGNPLLQG
jgi:hypothetical protein